ncbi:MAG: hypothetical protein QXM17_02690 [Metallosphaera sp.]
MNFTETKEMRDFRTRLKKSIYIMSLVAWRLNGEDREDALSIRNLMRELKNKLDKDANLSEFDFTEIYGAIILGLSILYSSLENDLVKKDLLNIQDTLSIGG